LIHVVLGIFGSVDLGCHLQGALAVAIAVVQ